MKINKHNRKELAFKYRTTKQLSKQKVRIAQFKKARSDWKQVLAQSMRDFPTPSERLVKATLLQMGFIHQAVVHGFIPDFAHFGYRVIVEIDGAVHRGQLEKDEARDEILRSHLWRVLRFTNQEVLQHPFRVYESVKAAIDEHSHRAVQAIPVSSSKGKGNTSN